MNLFASETVTLPKVTMRPYQEEALQRIEAEMDKGPGQGLLVLPTGTGKTSVFTELIARRKAGDMRFKALIVAHQVELLEQAAARIRHMIPGIRVSIESGDYKSSELSDVIVAGVQTIGRRGSSKLGSWKPNLIIVDEAHHAPADSYQAVFENFGVYEPGGPYLLGVTATPHRMDNKPLHGSDRSIFQDVVYTYTLREAIKDGFLCDVRGYRALGEGLDLSSVKKTAGDYNQGELQRLMDCDEVTACGIKAWSETAKDRRTVVFCTGIDHAKNVAAAFQKIGVKAESIDGKMNRDDREAVMNRFKSGETQVLTNMQLVTEGVDVPEIAAVLLLRPTQSWALYTQMVGRGLRLSPGKADCVVIDVVGNTESHQLGKTPPASVAGVFGLPPGLDLAGESAMEAAELFDELDESLKAGLFKRVIDMTGLRASIKEVDLLAELAIPEEVAKFTHWSWMKIGDGLYTISCGSTETDGRINCELRMDALGAFTLLMKTDNGREVRDVGNEIGRAFFYAEQMISDRWPRVQSVVSSRATWRKKPVSEKQRAVLIKAGYSPSQIDQMDMGSASAALNKYFARKGKR